MARKLSVHKRKSQMFGVHRQLISPTSVSCAACCHFTQSAGLPNIVVAQGNVLTVYKLFKARDERERLVVDVQETLQGRVLGMSVLKTPATTDRLVLAFADAKISVIAYDTENHSFKTVSLHYYETGYTFKSQVPPPQVRSDPDNRCFAMRFSQNKFAIVPSYEDAESGEMKREEVRTHASSFIVDSESLGGNIGNVLDFTFLHGYFEPTLAILYESKRSAANRITALKDTVSLAFVSIATGSRKHSLIHNVHGLPIDLHRIEAVPKPFLGVLMFGVNCIMHVDQSSRPFGVLLNAFERQVTAFDLVDMSDLLIHLEGSRSCIIAGGRCLFHCSAGNFYTLRLLKDGRQVRAFEIEHAIGIDSAKFSVLQPIGNTLVFLGSNDGDSCLYQYADNDSGLTKVDERPSKKAKVNFVDAPDELDFLLESADRDGKVIEETLQSSLESELCFVKTDNIVGIGCISDIIGAESAFYFDRSENLPLNNMALDMIGCSGYGSNACVWACQKSIKPYIRSTFELPDDTWNMWTLQCHRADDSSWDSLHKFLLITKESRFKKAKSLYTIAFETGQNLNELENSDFVTTSPTVFACALFDGLRVAQVYPEGVRLLDCSAVKTQDVLVRDIISSSGQEAMETWITYATSVENYLIVLLSNGHVRVLQGNVESCELVCIAIPQSLSDLEVSNISAFRDKSGLLANLIPQTTKAPISGTSYKAGSKRSTSNMRDSIPAADEHSNCEPTLWLATVSSAGNLEMYHLPSFGLLYTVPSFTGSNNFIDKAKVVLPTGPLAEPVPLLDFAVCCLGSDTLNSLCIISVDRYGTVVVYRGLSRAAHQMGESGVVFRKMSKSHLNIDDEPSSRDNGIADDYSDLQQLVRRRPTKRIITPFDCLKNLGSKIDGSALMGFFVTGRRPCLAFLSDRNELRMHTLVIDGSITAWAPFHNQNCTRGFLYFTNGGSLRIAQLDRRFDYHFQVPINRCLVNSCDFMQDFLPAEESIANSMTISSITYDPSSKKYCCIGFTDEVFNAIKIADPGAIIHQDDSEEVTQSVEANEDESIPPAVGKYFPTEKVFTLNILSTRKWELVDQVKFAKHEHITSLEHTMLDVKVSGTITRKPYIVIGTSTVIGEDYNSKGKIYIYEIIEVVPKPGRPETNHKIKLVKQEEMKGAVASACALNGNLCVAIGAKLMLYSFEDGESLIGVAFLDTNVYVTKMRSVKSLLLVGDICKGTWFVGYQEEPSSKMVLLGQDYGECAVGNLNFVIDDSTLGFIIADLESNIRILAYTPEDISSFSGHKLIRKSDFHIGSLVTSLFRIPNRKDADENERHGTLYASQDGGVGLVTFAKEKSFKRLHDICTELSLRIEPVAGLNPRGFRYWLFINIDDSLYSRV
eukprot:Partr_v1_DN28804_c0_g1_i2_m33332 putative Cleavage and polyadenylation